jgi:hypothetical protein
MIAFILWLIRENRFIDLDTSQPGLGENHIYSIPSINRVIP